MSEELNANKITVEIISDLSKSAAKTILKKLTKLYKDMVKKDEVDFGVAFENYLVDAEKNIRMAKTIFYGLLKCNKTKQMRLVILMDRLSLNNGQI